MFNFPKCPKCGNTLPIATGVCAICPTSPLPGQEDQSARLAASAEVGQVEGTTCSRCGYCHGSVTCVSDDEAVAWFDSQTEEFLAALPGYGEDGFTPRKAWNAFFSSSPATEAAPASSPAPVVAGQGEGTKFPAEPDFVVVRASNLRLLRLELAAALERAQIGLGKTEARSAFRRLLSLEASALSFDDLLQRLQEQGA